MSENLRLDSKFKKYLLMYIETKATTKLEYIFKNLQQCINTQIRNNGFAKFGKLIYTNIF